MPRHFAFRVSPRYCFVDYFYASISGMRCFQPFISSATSIRALMLTPRRHFDAFRATPPLMPLPI